MCRPSLGAVTPEPCRRDGVYGVHYLSVGTQIALRGAPWTGRGARTSSGGLGGVVQVAVEGVDPAGIVGGAGFLAVGAAFPAGVDQFDIGAIVERDEADLDAAGLLRVGAWMPGEGQALGWIPVGDRAPV